MPTGQPRPPMFRKLPNPINLGDQAFPVPETPFLSPTSVLERNLHSPKGWKNRESDGIGLGIVAALEKSGSFSASTPAAITSPRTASGYREGCLEDPNALFRPADFLSCCYLCSKRLHGRDIYMYRGEKAFCSMECRHRQIVSDDFKEKCGTEASEPSTEISSSPYSGGNGRLFFTGIVAA